MSNPTQKKNSSLSREEVINNFKQFHNSNNVDTPQVNNGNLADLYDSLTKQADHEALNVLLLDRLEPQLTRNEQQKRKFKKTLMTYILWVLAFQLVMVAIPIGIVYANICINIPHMKTIDVSIIKDLLEFLKYYITAIIAEFIAMLFFIVEFVFDKSIVGLIKSMTGKK